METCTGEEGAAADENEEKAQARTLIIGLGNAILSDDGAGIHAVREIARQCKDVPHVTVVEASLGGIGLLDLMDGFDSVIIVDSIITGHGKPGDVYRLSTEDLEDVAGPRGPHHIDIKTALQLGKRLGCAVPCRVDIYAVEIDDNTTFSERLTPAVEQGVPNLAKMVIEDLDLPRKDR
jgi:hydrogenase maturation protease